MPIYDAYILPIRAYPSSYRQNIGKIISRRGTNEGKIKLLIRDIPSKGDKAKRRDIKIAKTLTSYYGVPHTYWYNIEMEDSPPECDFCHHEMHCCWCEPRCAVCSRRRSFQLQKGVAFWFQEDDECAEWLCERCCDFDPKDPHVKSDKEGYTRWACEKRGEPSQEPETHMQTWPEFCEWGIVVEDEKKPTVDKK